MQLFRPVGRHRPENNVAGNIYFSGKREPIVEAIRNQSYYLRPFWNGQWKNVIASAQVCRN